GPVCLRELRCLNKSAVGIAIRLHEITKPPAYFTQPKFKPFLPAKPHPHDPQRSRERSHQGRDPATSWDRGPSGHRVQKVCEGLCMQINRFLLARRGLSHRSTVEPSLQSCFQNLLCIKLFYRKAM